eukprot:CAMPEP_0206056976 /NCGR_PEP_ID=MMETSP1466-20131121/43341_1 /ASSEMBLY_ACC=CAM_ASM_001126 /TAXON_ID=44452 /ORGANISM="Pavlova gyrans, Strain CCMP608" /LENGTH=52 /DNA_ID=CAMNT_0053432233 /DNA_START=41 /DNA_END=199 /DNA_ORIENTATION=-
MVTVTLPGGVAHTRSEAPSTSSAPAPASPAAPEPESGEPEPESGKTIRNHTL